MEGENFGYIIGGFMIGIVILAFISALLSYPIQLNQETANEICFNFTNVSGVEADSLNGRLICELPSFDSTQNIVIKDNNK